MTQPLTTVVAATITATITGLVAYALRDEKIQGYSRGAWRMAKAAARAVWDHTDTVVYVMLVAWVAVLGWQTWQTRAQSARVHQALCFFRHDLQERLRMNQFMMENADRLGLPTAARVALQVTIRQQKSAVASLGGVRCAG